MGFAGHPDPGFRTAMVVAALGLACRRGIDVVGSHPGEAVARSRGVVAFACAVDSQGSRTVVAAFVGMAFRIAAGLADDMALERQNKFI